MDVEQLLEVEAGRAQPTTIGLSPGETVGPLSIGRMGGWRVAANGVAAEHGWIYFDGQNLYLQSTDPGSPMLVDGQAVPTAWTPIHAPCTISFGAARLSFIAAAEEIERTADKFPAPAPAKVAEAPRPPTPRSTARPFAPGELAHRPDVADETRMGAMDVVAARARASALSRSNAPRATPEADPDVQTVVGPRSAPPAGPAPASHAPGQPPAGQPSPVGGPPAHHAPRAPLADRPTTIITAPTGVLAKWREASLPQKATLFLLPLALASVYVIFTEPPAADDAADGVELADPAAPSTSAVASAAPGSTGAAITATPAITASPTGAITASPIVAAPDGPATGRAESPPAPTVAVTAEPSRPSTPGTIEAAPASPAPSPAVVARPGSTPQRTLARRAADSVAAGDWEGAAELYEQLAKQHPDQPAYAEAARILRARSK